MTYTGVTPGRWESLDLTQDATDSTLWTGRLSNVAPGQVEFLAQAVNGVGLVSLDDNQGAFYRPGQIPPALQSNPAPLTTTQLTLAAPTSASHGSAATVSATVTATPPGGVPAPLAGATVRFSLGGTEKEAVTGANGVATVQLPLLLDAEHLHHHRRLRRHHHRNGRPRAPSRSS